jgi:ABC-type sugar transport system substrate-binding protein
VSPYAAGPSTLQALFNTAVGKTGIPVKSAPPLVQQALTVALKPLTSAQVKKAWACYLANSCTLGKGKITIGFDDGFGDNTWRHFSKIDAIIQAMQYRQVGKIIMTNAHGVLAAFESNTRSLVAQGAKAIISYNDFGPAAYPAFIAAEKQGAVISTYVDPEGAPTTAITTAVEPNICLAGKNMAAAVKSLIHADGPVAYLTGTAGNTEDAGWQKCATAAGIKSVFNGITDWTPAGAETAAAALIATGKPVKAIMYSYSNPVPNIVAAYTKAGKKVPPIVTFTQNNGTTCGLRQTSYPLYETDALNWAARVSVTAMVDKLSGQKVPRTVLYPMPFVRQTKKDCNPKLSADYPGASALVPMALVSKILG